MKAFFDTSVLVPVFYGDHIHYEASLELFIQFDKTTGCCGAHSLAEVYSTLTRMPGKHSISGEQAMLFVGSIRERLSLVVLDGEEYAKALQSSAAVGIVGGGIYDAMLAHCALKANVETIYTWTRDITISAARKSLGGCRRPEFTLATLRPGPSTIPR
jgi:predicted nucleic acid-binding protein